MFSFLACYNEKIIQLIYTKFLITNRIKALAMLAFSELTAFFRLKRKE